VLFRLYTENKNKRKIRKMTANYFENFSLVKSVGYYKRKKEKSLIIEVITTNKKDNKKTEKNLNSLSKDINKNNNQECCLIQKIENKSYLI
jgi:hypothetical protein